MAGPYGMHESVARLAAGQVNASASETDRRLDADDRRLAAARDSLPAWTIVETFGGYIAVPGDVEVQQSVDLDHLVGRLRSLESE